MVTYSFGHTVASLLQRAYGQYGSRPALVTRDGREVSYAELSSIVSRVAGGIAGLGAEPGDRVVIAMRNGEEFSILDHALFWGGYVRVAVSFRLHPQEIAMIAADADAKAVVVDPDIYEAVVASLAQSGLSIPVVRSEGEKGELTVAALGEADPVPAHHSELEDLAWMPYTSGTTGNPKGVMHTQASIMATLRNMMAELPPATSQDTLLQTAPMSHLAGWLGILYAIRGARQVFLRDFNAREALRAIERYRVTATPVVPTIVNLMTEEAERGDYQTSSLQTVIYAGSPMAPDKVARAIRVFGSVFVQCYGLTELPMPITALSKNDHVLDPDGSVPRKLASAGRVTPFVEVRVVDEKGNELPDGESGEIQVRADMAMRGYWRLPEESEAFVADDGWRGSGDVGRFEDGYLYLVDRKRDLIVSGGFNVFPSEVEAVIARLPGVKEVAVVGVPDPKWGETVLAAIVAEPDSDLDAESVSAACRASIAGYKQPRRIEFVEELPKNSSGKLMRRNLRDAYWHASDRHVGG